MLTNTQLLLTDGSMLCKD